MMEIAGIDVQGNLNHEVQPQDNTPEIDHFGVVCTDSAINRNQR